jgi:UDP-glucose:(heptosyl)LPS alpha-1,3-glucosyltransferase
VSRSAIAFLRRGYSTSGGAEAYLKRIASSLANNGTEVRLYSDAWPEEAWPWGEIVRVKGTTPASFAREVIAMRAGDEIFFSLERIPGCEIFRAGDGLHVAWLARRRAFEPRWKSWSHALHPKHHQLLALERSIFSPHSPTHVIANSQLVADEIREWFPDFPSAKVHIIPNGYDPPPALSPQVREALRFSFRKVHGIPSDAFVALFLGSGWERKGLRYALLATAGMPRTRLVVVGKGRARNYAAPHVIHLGEQKITAELFAGCDVLLHPTWYDPFSNACLEALSAGLPVITTRANGAAEALDHSITGSVISRADQTEELRAELEFWRTRIDENARQACIQAASRYSLEKNRIRTLELLQQVGYITAQT